MITASDNATLKLVKSLQKGKNRREHGLFAVEGEKLVGEASANLAPKFTLISDKYQGNTFGLETTEVKDSLLASICDTKTPQGIVAVFPIPERSLPEVKEGIVIALEDVQDPLNVGTIIRSADAFGAAAVILSENCADVFSPKVLRGTMGSLFHLPVVKTEEFFADLQSLRRQGFELLAADMNGEPVGESHPDKTVLVLGNEGSGISQQMRDMCHQVVSIPMRGAAESLNVSVAAGILLYSMSGV